MRSYIQATDLHSLAQCNRLVFLDHHGDHSLRTLRSAYQEWVVQQGNEHEARVAARFQYNRPQYHPARLEDGFRSTFDLMRQGVAYIYQGVLIDSDLVGIPDLMERVEGGSRLGGYFYRPIDIKLASEAQPGHRLQVMAYIALLEAIQGVRPDGSLFLQLPPDERNPDQLYREELIAFDRTLFTEKLTEVQAIAGSAYEPKPFISSTCTTCHWQNLCTGIAEKNQDASLISGLRRAVWCALHERGMGTLPAVAATSREQLISIKGVGEKTASTIILQARALTGGRSIQIDAPTLPQSDPLIFLDVESVPGEGIYYLMGTLVQRGRQDVFEYDLAECPEDELNMWGAFLQRMERLQGYIYHYGNYERTTIKRMVERYGEDSRAAALLDRLVDLQKVLKASVVLPLRGYSLKDVARWLDFEWSGVTQQADESMLEYLHWLVDGQRDHLDHILVYNEDDCRATARVYDWLASLPEDAGS